MKRFRHDADATRHWRPTALVGASIGVHAVALGALALRPGCWPWAIGAVAADHALLTASGLWPRSSLLGPNMTRLAQCTGAPSVALTIDDGPDPAATPEVLDILGQHAARATFFCIGRRGADHPALARDIVRAGHALENHSQRHLKRFATLGPRAMMREIVDAQNVIADTTGVAPRWFRAPAGLRNPFLDPILARLYLRLASWSRRGFDTVNANRDTVVARLLRGLAPGDILLLHDGNAARTAAGRPVIVEALPAVLAALSAARLTTVTLSAEVS